MKYLLDTCVVSDLFRKVPATLAHFERVSPDAIAIPVITIVEIECGLKLSPEREGKIRPLWQAFLKEITVLPFSQEAAICSGIIRAKLKKQQIGSYDSLIAGTALVHDLIIVTSNMREFARLADMISIENWRIERLL
jgi:tRNA(fMet)-specific endonuclease VapC